MKTSLIFLLGAAMGTAIGILIAPDAGKVTRRRIRDEADKIVDRAMAKRKMKALEKEIVEPADADVVVLDEH